jgi:outer membrane murein-binding lipoprotein Lpp
LIAEEVAEVFPELVVFNGEGQPETVKYRLLSALLLNELQKEHQVNQSQGEQIASLNAQATEVEELKARVAELSQLVQQMAKLVSPASELVATNAED